ncbi:hypothetical protein ACN4EK_29720 [Pantanalinema rosaneae CENA516]|uniref:hypothetical protein n=1 Tax=Pantanalinema rosaneae TaxID=1620701 RepID=UPI003D6F083D
MMFVFPPLIQAGIAAGQYEVVRNAAGVVLGIARDKATGQFVGNAVGALGNTGIPFNPLIVPLQFTQMYQMHRGFQAVQGGLQTIQTSLGVLQTMTALTGIGVAVNLGVSAVSLWQILKLREDVQHQRIEVKEGFLDLRKALKDQGVEIIQKVDEAIKDIEFKQHKQTLAQAYGRFLEATKLMQVAMSCNDQQVKNADLANARQILTESLADYKNPHLFPEANAITQLRRFECTWAIEQTIAITYQLQNQPDALIHCLKELQSRMCQNLLTVIDQCESEDELDIIFPEAMRTHQQDLVILNVWQEQVSWMRSLPVTEQHLLQEVSESQIAATGASDECELAIPPEQLTYEALKPKSHLTALCDALRLMIRPEERGEYETYISQQAKQAGHRVLLPSNLQQMSDLSVANLYWYFRLRDESEQEMLTEEALA